MMLASLSAGGVALLLSILLLAASLAKALSPSHARVDRLVSLAALLLVVAFFLERGLLASAKGELSLRLFGQFFLAGGVCAFVTHAACTPIDVVKTRMQTTAGKYGGMADACRRMVAEEGGQILLKGLGATAGGYFLHGAFKYSFYEVFKTLLSTDAAAALKPTFAVAALGGLFAECVACVLLCPMEAVRIRSVSDPNFPSDVVTGLRVLASVEGINGLYKGLPAILLKQVPYTVGQFVCFELSLSLVKVTVGLLLGGHSSWIVSSMAGLLAGMAAAVLSHPGDTILSKLNQQQSEGSPMAQMWRVAKVEGFVGLFVGLAPRLVQVSLMIMMQFLIYDSIKAACGIQIAAAAVSERVSEAVTAKLVPVSAAGAAAVAGALRRKQV